MTYTNGAGHHSAEKSGNPNFSHMIEEVAGKAQSMLKNSGLQMDTKKLAAESANLIQPAKSFILRNRIPLAVAAGTLFVLRSFFKKSESR